MVRFLPIIVDEEHASRAMYFLLEELVKLDQMTDERYAAKRWPNYNNKNTTGSRWALPEFSPTIGLRVISALMNSMVVASVAAAASGSSLLSEPLVHSYARFHHMLLFFCKRDPAWQREADQYIASFIAGRRAKTYVPDIGR